MKNFKLIKLLALFVVLITSIPQMWAYYMPGTIKANRWGAKDNNMGGDGKITFYAVPKGTYYCKLSDGNTLFNGAWTADSGGDGMTISYVSTQICITLSEERDLYFEVKADNKVLIKSLPASYRIYYNWAVDGSGWSDWLVSNGDGTYSCHGRYNAYTSNYYYRMFSSDDDSSTEGTTISYTGSPAHEDYCIFTYNASTNALNIRKASAVTHTNHFYFDNTNAQWSQTYTYFAMGTPGRSTMYGSMTNITNTQLKYGNNTSDDWTDVSYYAMAAGSSAWDGSNNWNYPALTGWAKRSAPNFTQLDLQNGYLYVIGKENDIDDQAITLTEKGDAYSALNFSLGYKYVLYDPSSSSWVDMTSSHGNTPAQISMTSYKFNSLNTVTANTTQTISANTNTTYTKSVTDCAYRGNTNLSYSNLSNAYKFIGWYDGNTSKNTTSSYDFYPTEGKTISARFEYRWSLKGSMLDQEWATDNYITHITRNGSGEDVGYVELNLPGNSDFVFKVVDRSIDGDAGKWWSCDGETFNIEDDNNVAKTCTNVGTESNMTFNTAAPGIYRFTWNTSTHKLTVTYPTSYKVTYDDNGKTSGSAPTDDDYYAPDATVTVLGDGTMVKSGYTFMNWNTADHGYGTNYSAGNTFSITEDVTLYAKWQNDSYTGKFTFHDGNPTSGFVGTWNVNTFTQRGTSEYYDIEDYTIPDPGDSPNFFVGYEGWAANPLGVSSGQSVVKDWDDNFVDGSSNVHGYLKVLPGYSPLSDGSSKTAEGATGTLTIQNHSGSSTDNLQIGFTPDGYGLTISYNDGSAKTQVIAFHSTENPNLWETDVLDGGLTSAKVSGTFKVGLATSSSGVYVDCYQSAAEAKAALDARKVTGTDNITNGVSGRFQILINSSATNFGLRYVPLKNVWSTPTSGYYYWDNYTGWSLGRQPTIDEDVVITESVTVQEPNARANSVRIDKSGSGKGTVRLTISDYSLSGYAGGLLVKTDILAREGEETEYRATTRNDVQIETGWSHNGALICGSKSTDTRVSYNLYSRSYMYGSYGYINQYIGIPFNSADKYDFYGSYLFKYNENEDKWEGGVSGMDAFKAYNLIQTGNSLSGFYLDGTLNLPGLGDGGNVTLSCISRTGKDDDGKDNDTKMDYLFANSWTAPIDISAMTSEDFSSNLYATIYIFNAGSGKPDGGAAPSGYDNPGNFTAYTAGSTGTIPGTQGFMVTAKSAGSHTLTLNYEKHVYNPALTKGSIGIEPTRAPKRDNTNLDETKLSIRIKGESGFADRLRIRERADFTNEFDNCFDATKAWGMEQAPQLYAKSGALDMTINAVPDMEGMVVCFRKGSVDDEYSATFEFEGEGTWYLNDLKEQTSTLIEDGTSFTFTSAADDAEARFVISVNPISSVHTGLELLEDGLPVSGTHKFIIDNQLYIIREGRMYDATGALVK